MSKSWIVAIIALVSIATYAVFTYAVDRNRPTPAPVKILGTSFNLPPGWRAVAPLPRGVVLTNYDPSVETPDDPQVLSHAIITIVTVPMPTSTLSIVALASSTSRWLTDQTVTTTVVRGDSSIEVNGLVFGTPIALFHRDVWVLTRESPSRVIEVSLEFPLASPEEHEILAGFARILETVGMAAH